MSLAALPFFSPIRRTFSVESPFSCRAQLTFFTIVVLASNYNAIGRIIEYDADDDDFEVC
jgi:hypothetical protein